jgi:predicted hydrocarbon binding protein
MEDISTHIRGVNAVLAKKWLLECFGEETYKTICDRISPDARQMLQDPDPNEWYEVSLTKEVYDAMDRELGRENPLALEEFGRFEVEQSVKGFLRYLARFLTVQQLFNRAKAFWKSFNRGGGIDTGPVIEEADRKKSTVFIRGSKIGSAGCKVLDGYIEHLIAQTGVQDIKVEKKACVNKGDKVCSWEVSWKDK